MKEIKILSLEGNEKSSIDLPEIFEIEPRTDIIRQAMEISRSKKTQPQGRDQRAGLRNTAEGWGTGHGMARTPRLKGSGYPTARNAGRVPYAKGGRRAHPIKAEKVLGKKQNKKLKRLSIFSAISASGRINWVKERGHKISNNINLPLVIDDKIQTIKKTSQIFKVLSDLGFEEELNRVKNNRKIRKGKGKRRGRKYKSSKGLLIVIKEDFGIVRAARNLPGVDIISIETLSLDQLAPGGTVGRLIIWTQSAINYLKKIN